MKDPSSEAPHGYDERPGLRPTAPAAVFDRSLARVTAVLWDTTKLKGGLVLGLRLERARTPRDVDLWLTGLAKRCSAGCRPPPDLADFMTSRGTQ